MPCRRLLTCALLLFSVLSPPLIAERKRPNFVLYLADDLGYGDLPSYGNQHVATPNLDRLAAEGRRWTDFYAAGPVCVPSRTGLMTGRYPARIHGEGPIPPRLPAEEVTIAEMLRGVGYRTAVLGKWHLGMEPGNHPNDQGFDYFYGTPSSNDHFALDLRRSGAAGRQNDGWEAYAVPLYRQRDVIEQPANQPLFTKRYTEEAIRFLRDNPDKPFFLYLANNMPHVPISASEEFRGRSRGGRLGDVIEEIDWSVGRIVQALRDTGLADNTLFVFTSDNGPWELYPAQGGSPGPLRNGKGTCWEGAFRVPAVFWWPGRIEPGVVEEFGTALDLFRTFATFAGAPLPPNVVLDSLDLSRTLLENKPSPRQTWFYMSECGVHFAARQGHYKIHLGSVPAHRAEPVAHEPPLLFNLAEDVGERHDIQPLAPGIAARLRQLLADFRGQLPARPTE